MLKVGISACFFHADPERKIFKGKTLQYFEQSMIFYALKAKAIPVLIPNLPEDSSVKLKNYVKEIDGLILQGGSDLSPKSYGEEPLKPEWEGDYIRDVYEIALLKECMHQKKPVLGICRGIQLINVALGGTLYQDIGTQLDNALVHRDWNIYDQNFHEMTIDEGTELSKIYSGLTRAKINSVHHQAIKDLGKGLKVEAYSTKDCIIEAARFDSDKTWVYGVQWHPEFQDPKDNSQLSIEPLLSYFSKQMRKWKRR